MLIANCQLLIRLLTTSQYLTIKIEPAHLCREQIRDHLEKLSMMSLNIVLAYQNDTEKGETMVNSESGKGLWLTGKEKEAKWPPD